jgi:hypothetical protein
VTCRLWYRRQPCSPCSPPHRAYRTKNGRKWYLVGE